MGTFKTLFTGIITGIYAADPKCERLRHCPKRVCEQIKIQKTLDFFFIFPDAIIYCHSKWIILVYGRDINPDITCLFYSNISFSKLEFAFSCQINRIYYGHFEYFAFCVDQILLLNPHVEEICPRKLLKRRGGIIYPQQMVKNLIRFW